MVGRNRAVVELDTSEVKALLTAQKIWQHIEDTFDNLGCDITYITDKLDKELSNLLTVCEDGILEEVE